ncbi:hypothetical protein D8X55_04660, partial [Malacoplasma penetrans]
MNSLINDQYLNQDILIIKKFQQIKFPLWILLSPIFGTFVFITFFRSFFKVLSEREFVHTLFLKIYIRKMVVLNSVIIFIMGVYCFLGIYENEYESIFIWFLISLAICSLIFLYIYQYYTTKWIVKNIDSEFQKYYWEKYGQEIKVDIDINTSLDIDINEIFYQFKFK